MTRQRRKVDPGVELEIVRMIKEQRQDVRNVSQSVHVGSAAICRWVAQYEAEQDGQSGMGKPLTREQQRMRHL